MKPEQYWSMGLQRSAAVALRPDPANAVSGAVGLVPHHRVILGGRNVTDADGRTNIVGVYAAGYAATAAFAVGGQRDRHRLRVTYAVALDRLTLVFPTAA
jgi:hypothetical protein